MAYDDFQADRISNYFKNLHINFYTKKMMGGLLFMVDDKMCVGLDINKKTNEDRLMVRVGPDAYEDCLQWEGAGDMDFTGRIMKGFIFVKPIGFDTDVSLEKWLDKAMTYNPLAKKSKKKKKK